MWVRTHTCLNYFGRTCRNFSDVQCFVKLILKKLFRKQWRWAESVWNFVYCWIVNIDDTCNFVREGWNRNCLSYVMSVLALLRLIQSPSSLIKTFYSWYKLMFCTQKMILVVAHIKGGQCHEVVPCPLSHQFCLFCQLTVLPENTSVSRKWKWPWQVCSMRSHLYFFLNCLKIGKSLCLSMHEYIGFKMCLWLLFVLACVGSRVLSCTCGDHRTALWSWFSVFLWVSGTELRLPALRGKLCPLSRLTWP